MRKNAGFTLIEVLIVLAVIGALAAVIAPRAFTYIDDARRTQAQNDANQIAAAIGNFIKATGVPPYKNINSADKIPAWVGVAGVSGDFECLVGGQGTAFTSAEDSTGSTWSICFAATSTKEDTIDNHLIANTPGGAGGNFIYKTTGKTAWKGPYLPSVPPDPWGKQYLVNIKQMDPAAATPKAAWVISSGPNGILETPFDQNAGVSLGPSGDDIIARVK
jgi:prepilin-type N-terminal cleavage/methylation domain-containing protein